MTNRRYNSFSGAVKPIAEREIYLS